MRRLLKILAWLLGFVILLLLAGMVAIQSPKIQTTLARWVVEKLEDRLPAQVEIGNLTVRPFDAIVLEDILLKDPHPYEPNLDTVIYVKNLTAKFSLGGLLRGKMAHVKRLKLDGGQFNLIYEPDSARLDGKVMNLYRVLGKKPNTNPQKEPPSWGKLLSAKAVEVKDFTFRMYNPVKQAEMLEEGRSYGEGVIDWNDFTAYVHGLLATQVEVADNHITGTMERLQVRELNTGFSLDELSARKANVGEAMVDIDGLRIHAGETDLSFNKFVMDGPLDDYSEFIDRIWLEADILPGSFVSMPTIRYFSQGINDISFASFIEGQMQGYVNDINLEKLILEDQENEVQIQLNGRMWGLPDTEDTRVDIKLRKLAFGLDKLGGFVKAWSPDTKMDLSRMAKGERFNFHGRLTGPLNRLHINGDLDSNIGEASADITLQGAVAKRQSIRIGGKLETENLDLGRIIGSPSLGPLSLRSGLEATFPRGGDMQVRIDSLDISRLHALGYDYSDISAVGTYSQKAFDGRIIAADPNLNLLFQGMFNLSTDTRNAAYRFYASLGYANLHALNLDKRERSIISFQAMSNILRTQKGDFLGDMTISDISLDSNTGRYDIGDITLQAHSNDNVNRIRLQSNFLEGTFVGDEGPGTFLNDLRYLVLERDVPALLEKKPQPWNGATYDLSLNVKSAQGLLTFLVPGLYIEKNTTARLQVDEDGLVTATVKSGRLAYDDKFVKDFLLSFDNGNQVQTATLTGKQISLSGAHILNNQISLFADDNQLGIGYTFDNGEEEQTRAQVYLSADLMREEGGLAIAARALPSNIYYMGKGWGLSSEEITYSDGNLDIQRLTARHDDETLLIHGGISPHKADTLSIQMDKFDIGLVNTISGNLPSLEGYATGQATIISPSSPTLGLLSSITVDSTYVAGHRMGKLLLSSVWDEEYGRFVANVENQLNGRKNIQGEGYIQPADHAVHADVKLDHFNMGYAAPLLNSLFSQFGGYLSGQVGVDGTLDKPHLSSRNLRIEDGTLELDYTRVPYDMSGDVDLNDEGLFFRNVQLSDGLSGKGKLSGSILLGEFKDFAMDTHVQITDMKVLDLPQGVNPMLWGTATATGRADITGPINRLLLDVDATTSRSGELHIGLGSSGSSRSREMLSFKEAPFEGEEDPYEVMMAARSQEKKKSSDFQIRLRVHATPQMQLHMDISESSLSAQGNGTVELTSRSSTGSFGLNGDYNITQGSFLFSAMNLVSRRFTIQDGSTIRFNGDVWDTDLDVKGLYTTKASLSTLISDESSVSRRTVNCGINITGRLSNPEINFSIDIPDLNPATQAQVEAALNTVDKVQKQFVYLLIAGNFLPAEESGITTSGTDALFSNMSSIMSGQINNIFEKLNIPLDMGLNYQTTQTGSNIFDVALSTQLFNNRVIVNGTVGNKQMLGGTSTNEVVGDIDIEIKLNRSGSLRLKLFSHSADQYTSFLDNSQRHGGGISYQRDFNSFRQLFRMIVAKKEERENMVNQEVLQTARSVVLNVDEQGKISKE